MSRKLDKGIEILSDIKGNTSTLPEVRSYTSALPEVKGDTSAIKVGIDNLNVKFGSFIVEQMEHNKRMDEHNLRMDEHNRRLEKILEKLAER